MSVNSPQRIDRRSASARQSHKERAIALEANLSALTDELLDGWVAFVGESGPSLTDWRGRSEAQIATIMTLTAHIHSTAMILRPALPDGLTIAHMPLVRSIFESTITVSWCDEVADGANGLINEGSRQRRNLRDALAKTRSMAQIADEISGVDFAALPTSSTQQSKYMERRCDDVGLDGAYAFYRMLSGLSHTSINTIDAYLDADSFVPGEAISVKSNAGPLSSSYAWSHLVASCLVWSGMVTNYLDRSRSRRNDLRRIARQLGIRAELPVRVEAQLRGDS